MTRRKKEDEPFEVEIELEDEEQFEGLAPVLAVDDLQRALLFYRDTLGFAVRFMWGDPPHFGIVSRDNAVIHLSEREDTRKKISPQSIYVYVRDVAATYAEFRDRDVEIFQPPADQEYGMREFEIHDGDGHFITFGQVAPTS